MSFKKNFKTYLIKSNSDISEISHENGVVLYNYNNNFQQLSSKSIITGTQSFVDTYFNIDSNDNVYGLINTKRGSLLYISTRDNCIIKTPILTFDGRKNYVKFPYIKKINNELHIFYYYLDATTTNSASIIHHYFDGICWHKHLISKINYYLLTNFCVIFENQTPHIFFFKKNNKVSEIFYSSYNLEKNAWITPIQLTATNREKVYLSVIKTKNIYHLTYSENINNKYNCIYFSVNLDNDTLNSATKYIQINNNSVCSFPNLIIRNSTLFIQWIENNRLFSSTSKNNGLTWTDPHLSTFSEATDFYRCHVCYNPKLLINSEDFSPIFFASKNSITPIL